MNTMAKAFDTLQYAKKLKEAGFTEQQAEVQAETLAEIVDNGLATKHDILDLKRDLESNMKNLEYRLIITMGSFSAMVVTVLGILIKTFHV